MELSKQNFPLLGVSLADDLCPEWKPTEVRNFFADYLPETFLFMHYLLDNYISGGALSYLFTIKAK